LIFGPAVCMSPRVRHHVNPLRLDFLERRPAPLPLPIGAQIEVELGCADARFLFERAPHYPEIHFIGLEIRESLVEDVRARAQKSGIENVEAHFANINLDLDDLFADGALRRVFINFPDPWFKRRHQKRRLVTPELVEILWRKLSEGGELFFQSDVFALALDALAAFEAVPTRLQNTVEPWRFLRHNPYNAKSLREVRCEERGCRIWRLRYRKLGDTAAAW
jgi:tRNA (guanine-N7-)-methyltransferase